MEPLKKLLASQSTSLLVFAVAFVFLCIASNSHNIALGLAGILLTVLNAVVILAAK